MVQEAGVGGGGDRAQGGMAGTEEEVTRAQLGTEAGTHDILARCA